MGGFAMSDNLTARIEQLAPELEKIISTSEPIEHLADGFGGAQGPAEGPLWWEEGGYLLFSDIHNDRRMKYQPGSGVSLFLEPTNRANGLTRDLQGRLLACEHDSRRVTRQEADGSITVVANSFQGRRLNRPNDVVVRSDGCIYFTDPWTSPAAPQQWDLSCNSYSRDWGSHLYSGKREKGCNLPLRPMGGGHRMRANRAEFSPMVHSKRTGTPEFYLRTVPDAQGRQYQRHAAARPWPGGANFSVSKSV
jgi:sugar lactone lactonase YvrE